MAQQVPGGMVVVAGDGYLPGTRFHSYLNDVWRLDFESMTWTQAVVDPTLRAPAPRRGHSTVAFRVSLCLPLWFAPRFLSLC